MKALNFYERLGVSRDAKPDEIRKQYYKLAQIFHPDKTGGNQLAEEGFKLINEAYECLSDKEKRSEYDRKIFANVSPDTTSVTPPPSNNVGILNPFWQNAAAFGLILLAIGMVGSGRPKPKRRFKKRKKPLGKLRRQTAKRK